MLHHLQICFALCECFNPLTLPPGLVLKGCQLIILPLHLCQSGQQSQFGNLRLLLGLGFTPCSVNKRDELVKRRCLGTDKKETSSVTPAEDQMLTVAAVDAVSWSRLFSFSISLLCRSSL
jgi:hypothetical protein